MSPWLWLGIGFAVWFFASQYQQQSDVIAIQSASTGDLRSRLDALAVLAPCCTTPESQAALDRVTSAVLHTETPSEPAKT